MLDDVAAAPDELTLWELMSQYNWDDGFAVPLAVIQHPACDRGLALRMFWELDDAGQTHYLDEDSGLREAYVAEAEHETEEFELLLAYSTALVDGLRNGKFQRGRNPS